MVLVLPVRRSRAIRDCFRSLFAAALLVCAVAQAGTPDEERTQIRRQSHDILARLYEARPGAKAVIAGAAGYATFRNFGLKVGVAGTGKGRGLAVRTRGGQETFMRYVELQAGVGVGVRKYDLVFVFENEQAYQDFVQKGWQYGGQSTVAAKHKAKGKAIEDAAVVAPGVWLYQITSSGLAAEVTLKSSKYFQDKELN